MFKSSFKGFLKKKRSQTSFFALLLIVLIVFVSFLIVWNFFNLVLRSDSKKIEADIFSNKIEIKSAAVFLTGASRVDVYRSGGNLTFDSLKFVFEDENGKTVLESVEESPLLFETKSYYFSPFESLGKIKKISVYPVVDEKHGIGDVRESAWIFKVPNGLVGWWKLSGDLEDSVGGNRGKIYGDVEFFKEEQALRFNNGYVDFGNYQGFNIRKDFAFSFWIRTNSSSSNFLKKGRNYELGIDGQGRVYFSFSSNNEVKTKKGLKSINDNSWHHVVVTNMMSYVDGEQDSVFEIGEKFDLNEDNLILGEGFKGLVKELIVFNRSLSKEQVDGIYEFYKED